jgi:hypothetical protein
MGDAGRQESEDYNVKIDIYLSKISFFVSENEPKVKR